MKEIKLRYGLHDFFNKCFKNVSKEDILQVKLLSYIASMITKERIARKMSVDEFSHFLGLPKEYILNIENDIYDINLMTLVHICNKLNLHIELKIVPDDI